MTLISTQAKLLNAQTPCEHCPFHKCESLRRFTPAELEFIRGFKRGELVLPRGTCIYSEGVEHQHLYTILSGWAFRFKTLEDGRRQILNFALPGDLVGLQNAMFNKMRHSVEALTEVRLCIFDRKDVWKLYRDHPELAFDLTWIAAREEAMLHEHLVTTGRRSGIERVGYVLLHLYVRLEQLGLVQENSAVFPMTQTHLADALGLSIVHTNKTIQKLTRLGLMEWRGGVLRLIDRARLTQIAFFDVDENQVRPFI